MYGGHITDDWDRRLCKTYLEEYMNPTMVSQDLYFNMKRIISHNYFLYFLV